MKTMDEFWERVAEKDKHYGQFSKKGNSRIRNWLKAKMLLKEYYYPAYYYFGDEE